MQPRKIKPKLSVLVVVHEKYLKHLPKAIQSLKQSSSPEIERIIVANGCKLKQPGFRVLEVPDMTLAAACNWGIHRAKGKYIVRLDADDWIDPGMLKAEMDYLDANPGTGAVWCDYWKTYEKKGKHHSTYHMDYCPQTELEHACGAMYRKWIWEDLGGYNGKLRRQEAYDFWLRFHMKHTAARIPIPLYYYRQHESMSSNLEEKNQVRIGILHDHC